MPRSVIVDPRTPPSRAGSVTGVGVRRSDEEPLPSTAQVVVVDDAYGVMLEAATFGQEVDGGAVVAPAKDC